MPQLTKKQGGRPPLCRYCYHVMKVVPHEEDAGYTATCPRCPHVIEWVGDPIEVKVKPASKKRVKKNG